MSSELESSENKELKAAFAFFDRNNNGNIEIDELDAAMKSLGKFAFLRQKYI